MIITDFTHQHLEQAQILAKQNYSEEKKIVHGETVISVLRKATSIYYIQKMITIL